MKENKVLILFFHPRFENSVVNKKLVECINKSLNITFRDIYEIYPDYNIDVKIEQEILSQHDVIIWQHPFYWYSCPPLMKQWIDLVLEIGWAYGKNGDQLKGKKIMNVISSGGTFDVYNKEGRNRFTYRELLTPFDQTAYLCGMKYLPPFISPNANRIDGETLNSYCQKYKNLLQDLIYSSKDEKYDQVSYMNELNF
jgi:glutathione-regulated potassium-efflux system ancillary protein KefG